MSGLTRDIRNSRADRRQCVGDTRNSERDPPSRDFAPWADQSSSGHKTTTIRNQLNRTTNVSVEEKGGS